MQETPTMLSMTSASSSYGAGDFVRPLGATNLVGGSLVGTSNTLANTPQQRRFDMIQEAAQPLAQQKGVPMPPVRRIIQVIIADSNENVPLDDCVLYKGEQKLTDATDQELFFEIDIKNILEIHNEKRIKFIDKKVKERTEHLEPAKVRDLKMVVITVATL